MQDVDREDRVGRNAGEREIRRNLERGDPAAIGRLWEGHAEELYARQMYHAAYLRNMLELSEGVQEPLATRGASRDSSEDTPAPWYAIVARNATPSGTDLIAEVAIARARARMSRTFLAIMRHHEQTGQFPPQIPISGDEFEDPFTDEPFIYRLTADGFLLYSVGPDRVDNDAEPYQSRTRQGDLVWQFPPGE